METIEPVEVDVADIANLYAVAKVIVPQKAITVPLAHPEVLSSTSSVNKQGRKSLGARVCFHGR